MKLNNKNLNLLIIGHVWPQPNATAAGEHIMHLLDFFKRLNYKILFVSAAQLPNNYSYLDDIQTKGIKLNDDEFDQLLTNFNPNVVLFDRFMTEEQFSWRIYKNCPNAIRILDTEDLHFLRNQRLEILKKGMSENLSDIAKRELASIYRSDLSLIISQKEIQLLTTDYSIPSTLLEYIPLLNYNKIKSSPIPFSKRKNLIFVGNFLHEPNWNCVQYLKNEIWPELSKLLPDVILNIYGSHASEKHLQLSNAKERFLVHGYVEDIEAQLVQSKLLIAPIQFGAGQKGKLLKAMQCQLPSITTPTGAEGMLFNNKWGGSIATDAEDIISQTIRLYTNENLWNDAQSLCSKIINRHFDFETHFSVFKKTLEQLQKNIHKHRMENVTGQILWHHNLRSTEFMSRWITEKNKYS